MKWCYKSVNYFKFFDDIKLIEVDELHNRIAIVFNGKESLINIFDLTPYVKYSPFIEEYVIDSDSEDNNNQTKKESDDSIENEDKSLLNEHDIDKMFQKVKLSNDDNSHNTNDKHFYNKPIIIDSTQQHCIILGDFISPKTNNTHTNKHSFPLHTLNTFNYSQETIQTIKHPQYKITSFNFTYKASIQRKQILLSIHKPKIQTKILSVISLQAHAVQKIKWFTFPSIPQIHPSKYLLTTTEEGSISIFQLKKITLSNETKVNLEDLQLQPFSNYPEEWHLLSSNIHQIPIRDFYIIEVTEPEQKYMKLLTLHIDNNISFWLLSKEQNNIKISPYYSINFDHSFLIENILIDKYENFLYCFNSKGIEIYKIKSTPPFPKIYWTL